MFAAKNELLTRPSGGYKLTRSLRFRSSASAYLNRTPATASNRKTFTWSGWVKRGTLSTYQNIFSATTGGYPFILRFDNDNTIFVYQDGTSDYGGSTSAVYRDPAAWYHIVLAMDTTQATDTNRLKLYVNGVQNSVSAFYGYFALNLDTSINSTGAHIIGQSGSANYFDGYMTEVNFIDGQALAPTAFGTFNSYGVWQPITYGGSYGTNGFRLPFTNNASTTTLGYDFSPQGNNWTTNNISVTAGATYDSMTDVPTLTSATAANFATWNPLIAASTGVGTITNGNLQCVTPTAGASNNYGTMGIASGNWYWEMTVTARTTDSHVMIGINDNTQSATEFYSQAKGYAYRGNGEKWNNGSGVAYGSASTTGDIIGVAFDAAAGSLEFFKNGSTMGVAFTGITASTYFPAICDTGASVGWTATANFGQRPFTYTPPSGFLALNTFNL